MKCQVCQADLAPGATFCTNCGTPVASNPYGGSPSSPNQGIAPTMLASASTPPPDPYGAPPPLSNPYDAAPPPPPANPYGTPSTNYGVDAPPPPASPYGVPPATPYGAPPAPGYNPNLAYGQPQFVPQQPQKKGPNGCAIAAIIVVALVVLVGGVISYAVYQAAHTISNNYNNTISSLDATATADIATANALLTPTAGGSSTGVPSTSQIDPNAKANIFNAQTASGVDTNSGQPTGITTSFASGDKVYITFQLSGKGGYTTESTYDNSSGSVVLKSSTPHVIDSGSTAYYYTLTGITSGSYTTAIYWCTQSNCSDAALAQVVTFTVS